MKQASAEDQYRRYSQLQKSEALKFVEWTKQQQHLPEITEFYACCFLHACSYSLEVAKQTYDLFCTTRTMCSEFFGKLDICGKDMTEIMKTIAVCPLRGETPKGQKVYVAKLLDSDPSKYILSNCVKLYIMCVELTLNEEGISDGIILVFDFKDSQISHLACLNPLVMKKFIFFLQECPPLRLHSIHFVNVVPFLDKILSIVRPLISKEVQNKLFVHSTLETFYEHVPKEFLPVEYGGNEKSVDSSCLKFYAHMKNSKEFFIEKEKYGHVNEKLRPGKPKIESDVFGIEGNFKKLNID